VREHTTLLRRHRQHHSDGFVVISALFHDGRAKRTHRGVLVRVVAGRNADGGLDAEQLTAIRNALPMIPRRRGNDAA
jgi:hypothetical protein